MNFIIRNIYKYNDVIDKYCIYLGDSDNSNQIIVAEVGAIDSTRQYRPISCLTNMVMFIDKILFIHPNTTISPLFIKGKIASITPSEFYDLLKDLCKNILNVYETDILKLIDNNYDSVNDKIIDVKFSEKLLRFLIWTDKKEKLKFLQKNNVKNVIQNNVYWAYMGCNLGCEIEKLRPVLIWKEHINFTNTNENSYFVFPISSKIPKKKYYYNIEIYVNGKKNIIKVNDGKRISIKRIEKPLIDNSTKKTYFIDQQKNNEIKDAIKKYFNV